MESLEALAQERFKQDKEDRSAKRANKNRLIVTPPRMSKAYKLLRQAFWHTKKARISSIAFLYNPHGEWLCKASDFSMNC